MTRESWAPVWKALKRKPLSLAGLGLLGFFGFVAAAAPVLAPPAENARDAYLIPQDGYSPDPVLPSREHWFGTTEQQYDLYYGIVWGTRTSLRIGVKVVFVSLLLGVLVGGVAGFYGGRTDELLMRLTDVVMALPSIILAVVIVTVRGPGSTTSSWPGRGLLALLRPPRARRRPHGQGARVRARRARLGAGDARILLRHVIPNSIYRCSSSPRSTPAPSCFGRGALLLGAGRPGRLRRLGPAHQHVPQLDLGRLREPWPTGTPSPSGLAIFLFVLGWNVGDAFRDILDPRQK